MKEAKIPSHQVDVVEIMRKIRQSAAGSRSELTLEEKVKREAKSEFQTYMQTAQVPDTIAEEIRQRTLLEPYDPRTLYASSRPGVGTLIGLIRKILRPITKLFINLDPLAHEVHKLTILNNLYLKTIQDLVVKTSALRVEIHHLHKRLGHHRPRDENRYGREQNHRRFSRDRRNRREQSGESRNAGTQSIAKTAEEPQT